MSLFGPTQPLRVADPAPRDIVESDAIVERVGAITAQDFQADVLRVVEMCGITMCRLAHSSLQGGQTESQALWAKAYAFGSAGLDANVLQSDVDVYVGCFPGHPLLPQPTSPPTAPPSKASATLLWCFICSVDFISRVVSHHTHTHNSLRVGD